MRKLFWLLAATAGLASGCSPWLDPLPETPENLRLGVYTVFLKTDRGPEITREAAARMVQEASDYWQGRCGISFKQVGHFVRDPEADGAPIAANSLSDVRDLQYRYSHLNYVSTVFTTNIEIGYRDRMIGGLSVYPDADRRAILMAGAYSGIFAHELGHYLSLEHVEDNGWNLMFPADVVTKMEYRLEDQQCADARRHLLGHANLRGLCRPDAADETLSKTNCPAIGL